MDDSLLDDHQSNALRIVLIGKTGCGKSATANTILGEDKFVSTISSNSITKKCHKAFVQWKDKDILVVDTPGLFDTKEKLDTTCREISRCIIFSSPGPHAIILVLSLGRYTEEEQKVFAMVKALFGESVTRHMIVVFTRKDELEDRSLPDFIDEADVSLKNMLKECGSRYCAFSNKAAKAEKEAQVQELMQLIQKMIHNNTHFTDNIYKDVEERLKKMARSLIRIFDDQLKNEIQLLEKEYVNKPQEEKEQNIQLLKEKHAACIRNIREEAGINIFHDILYMISNIVSKLFPFLKK